MATSNIFDEYQSGKTLLQLYLPVLTHVSTVAITGDFGDAKDFSERTRKGLESIRQTAFSLGKNPDWVADCQYVIVAYIDECISRSAWTGKTVWMQYPLVSQMGLEPNRGVMFFEKLAAWMQSPRPPAEALEVFYTCLGLGFEGQYNTDKHKLAQLKRQLLERISSSADPPQFLSENALQNNAPISMEADVFPWTWFVGLAIGAVVLTFTLFKWLSSSEITRLVEALRDIH